VGIAIESKGYDALAEVLNTQRLSPEEAKRFAAILPSAGWTGTLHRALQGERASGLYIMGELRRNPKLFAETLDALSDDSWSWQQQCWYWFPFHSLSPLSKLDEVFYLQYMNQTVAQNALPPFTPAAFTPMNPPWYAIMSSIITPVYARMGQVTEREEVRHRLAEAALSLGVYRAAHGQYPATLTGLRSLDGSPLPIDPYGGKAFVYRLSNKGYDLYSVGANCRDEGGIKTRGGGDDIAWAPPESGRPR